MTPTKRSSTYRFTVESRDDQRLVDLKKEMRAKTLADRETGDLKPNDFYKVYLQGRLGEKNPNAHLYRTKRSGGRIKVEHAARFDVYVTVATNYPRSEEKEFVRPVFEPTPEQLFVSTFGTELKKFIQAHADRYGAYVNDYTIRPFIVKTLANEIINRS